MLCRSQNIAKFIIVNFSFSIKITIQIDRLMRKQEDIYVLENYKTLRLVIKSNKILYKIIRTNRNWLLHCIHWTYHFVITMHVQSKHNICYNHEILQYIFHCIWTIFFILNWNCMIYFLFSCIGFVNLVENGLLQSWPISTYVLSRTNS